MIRRSDFCSGQEEWSGEVIFGMVLGPVLGVCFGRGFRAFVGRGALARQKLILVRLRGSNFCKLFSLLKNSKITSAIHFSNSLQHFTSEITSAKHFRKHSSKQSGRNPARGQNRAAPPRAHHLCGGPARRKAWTTPRGIESMLFPTWIERANKAWTTPWNL